MGPGVIRHLQIWWSIARVAGIWHRLNYFDNNSRPGMSGFCNNEAVGLLWPMGDDAMRQTARHEAYHLALLVIDESRAWPDIEGVRGEALALAETVSAMAGVLNDYRARGWSIRDEPLVLLSEAMAAGVDLAGLGASPRLVALVRAIVKPKPLWPALRAAAHVLAGVAVVWAILSGIAATITGG